ncbi:MAG: MoaD/ThiS family protein, partial [Syntrophorhabdus sp.]
VCRYAKELAMNVNWEGQEYTFEKPMLVSRLLEELKIDKEGHLVVANNRLVTEDHRLSPDDNVRVIRVVSGG